MAKEPLESEFAAVLAWAKEHDPSFAARIESDEAYFKKILNIEKDRKNPRKDYAKYSDIYPLIKFFYDDEYEALRQAGLPFQEKFAKPMLKELLLDVAARMPYGVEENEWFSSIKEIGGDHGFAVSNKDYKANPEAFAGSLSDVAEIVRVALVASNQSPNLHEIIEILGKEKCTARLLRVASSLA